MLAWLVLYDCAASEEINSKLHISSRHFTKVGERQPAAHVNNATSHWFGLVCSSAKDLFFVRHGGLFV